MSRLSTLVLVTTLLLIGAKSGGSAQDNTRSFYEDAEFRLKTKVLRVDSKDTTETTVYETYSKSRGRARVRVIDPGFRKANNEYFYDIHTKLSLISSNEDNSCQSTPLVTVVNHVFDEAIVNLPQENEPLIFGPAKLLYIFRDNIHNFFVDQTQITLIRNRRAQKYSWTFGDGESKAQIQVYYELSKVSVIDIKSSLPLALRFKSKLAEYYIEYFDLEILNQTIDLQLEQRLQQSSYSGLIDELALPVGMDCWSAVKSDILVDLLEPLESNSKLSFEVTGVFRNPKSQSISKYVALDLFTMMMRIDSRDESRQTNSILDLKNNIHYFNSINCAIPLDGLEQLNQPDQSRGSKETGLDDRCVTRNIWPPQYASQYGRMLSRLLFGGRLFLFLGNAQVRGINARVYESRTLDLPIWLEVPILYRTRDGKYGTQRRNKPANKDVQAIPMNHFNVLVYVASDDMKTGSSLPKILLVELYDGAQLQKPLVDRMVASVHIHNFVWSLENGPDGTSVGNLFSLRRLCSGATDGHLQVELELTDGSDESLPSQEPLSLIEWLQNWRLRNEALISDLVGSFDIPSALIYDFESRVSMYGVPRIVVSFRIQEPPMMIQQVEYISSATINHKQTRPSSMTLEECLRALAAARLSETLLVYHDGRNCQLLRVPDVNLNPEENDSRILDLSVDGAGELFAVNETYSKQFWKLSDLRRFTKTFYKFEGRSISLRPFHTVTGGRSKRVVLAIAKIRVRNFNYLYHTLNETSSQLLSGFSIVAAEPISRSVGVSAQDDEDSTHVLVMDESTCRSDCEADLDCKSFSFCNTGPDYKCVLSSVNVISSDTRSAVARAPKASSTRVKLDSQVELQRDYGCDVHAKQYSNYFTVVTGVKVNPVNKVVRPASSQHQCADICFAQTLEAIRLEAELNRKLSNLRAAMNQAGQAAALHEQMEQIYVQHQRLGASVCDSYFYASLERSAEAQAHNSTVATESPTTDLSKIPIQGYCMFNSEQKLDADAAAGPPENAELDVELYAFNYEHLYSAHAWLTLRQATDMEPGELDTRLWLATNKASELTAEQRGWLSESVGRKRNYQALFNGDAKACAERCFAQSDGLWPSCRSFDVVLREQQEPRCYLNTMTLAEARQQDIVKTSGEQRRQRASKAVMTHYEPRFTFPRQQLAELQLRPAASSSLLFWLALILGSLLGGLASFRLVKRATVRTLTPMDISVPLHLADLRRF